MKRPTSQEWISHRVQRVTILATIGIATDGTTGTEATVDAQRNVTIAAIGIAAVVHDHIAGSATLAAITEGAQKETFTEI